MIHPAALAATALLLAGCETTNMASRLTNLTAIQQGGGTNNTTTGAAGGDASTGASAQLEKCDAPLGTLALVENLNAGWYTILRDEYRLPPTANLLRLMVQQSYFPLTLLLLVGELRPKPLAGKLSANAPGDFDVVGTEPVARNSARS